ncbi:uncharacterized protein BX664DRAFT_386065 [Halteromyces radiatus]|uniref:uncharacterized protein n=1 Tax=Halteromyces radiatus TaxID=101107 RepID=UPI002220F7CF|nr:uncharacterized protein BX664DRAFT_386065 [Halteromyces radiatus]KAI8089604.1 hypothetical protein BX664DRAFT_386065 [Halteromyces radiatus]
MVSTDLQDATNDVWFHIRSIATGNLITCISSDSSSFLRSQVYVCPYQQQSDYALWTWDGSFLRNKASQLVLDIRKGRLRMMEDTEICLFTMKSPEDAHNQLWGCKDVVDDLGRKQQGSFIYSLRNEEWVLDIGQIDEKYNNYNKLILFPSQTIDNENQRWILEPVTTSLSSTTTKPQDISSLRPSSTGVSEINTTSTTHQDAQSYHEFSFSSSRSSSSVDLAGMDFPYGLMPAKRGSQSSVLASSLSTFKENHQLAYIQRASNLNDKSIAMAVAYETWQTWKKDQLDQTINTDLPLKERQDKLRVSLQSLARTEATRLLNDTNTNINSTHQQSVLTLTNRYIIQLYEQLPSTP